MQVTENNALFTEITTEESAIVSGGSKTTIGVSLSQQVFALGAGQYTLLLTGDSDLARSVLTTQFNKAFTSVTDI